MQAVYLTGYGGLDRLRVVNDAPVPVPAVGEVLVRVGACGINNTDLWTREGAYGEGEQAAWMGQAFTFPRIQGLDAVGQIVAVGADADRYRLGQRVMVNSCLYAGGGDGLEGLQVVGSERDGGFAQFLCVPGENALAIRSSFSDAELATFMTPYMTAEHMLRRAGVSAGERVLVTGASGGVGSALVQLALLRGAEVVAVCSQAKLSAVRALGAHTVIAREQGDYRTSLMALGVMPPFDVVADIVAGEQAAQCLDLLRHGGRYVTAGAVAGAMVRVDWRRLYLKQLSLFGVTMGTAADAQVIVQHIEAGRLRPLLAGSFPLEDIARAQQVFATRSHVGSLVLLPPTG
ncbi:zinc-binding dehydrogenase [Hydrogenophaga sp. RWCD_12]|uniref:zinc-binding dehydrogenase n=1 Tax=Hydrogenophaga sp. RWCD_12 TaxID=3391190 RepID=UPI003984FEC0